MTRLRSLWLALAIAGAAVACGARATPMMLPDAGGASITRGAMAALAARWDDVQLSGARSVNCAGASVVVAPRVSGDFNGDGTTDVAVWIAAGGATRLAALFARLGGEYTTAEVGEPAAVATGQVEVLPRGTVFVTPSSAGNSYLGLDTIVLRDCAGARTAWLWTGDAFRAQVLLN